MYGLLVLLLTSHQIISRLPEMFLGTFTEWPMWLDRIFSIWQISRTSTSCLVVSLLDDPNVLYTVYSKYSIHELSKVKDPDT